jgi:hypothetical protein
MQDNWRQRRGNGRMVLGLILAGVGLFLLLRMFGLLPSLFFPFHFGWPFILVVIGLIIGIKNNFRKNAWWILILIGGTHLLVPYFPYIGDVPTRRVLWPLLLVVAGIVIILRRNDDHHHRHPEHRLMHNQNQELLTNDADTINVDATFAGRKEVITSRAFKGGVIRATFSGIEVNMAAAEAGTKPMILEAFVSFAGVEIIVPSHWEVQNEIQPTLGSVEDHRMIRLTDSLAERPLLILRGSCSFGSVEIKSY